MFKGLQKKIWRRWAGLEKMIKAIFQSTGVEEGNFGRKGILIFTDLSEDGKPLTDKYIFSNLKCFAKLKPKRGDVFEFDATIDFDGGLKITRPKQVKKVDLSGLAEGYEYCINKFLKESRVLTTEDARKENVAYIRMATLFGEELFRYIELSFKLNSLYWFLTEDGQKFCREEQAKMENEQKEIEIKEESVILQENKVGQDTKIPKRKQSLINFLK
jgi:hypothetical protein